MIKVILVDEKDNEIGVEEKMKAHKEGKLHRAFSVLLFNKKGELLIQKRAKTKYHTPGLWSNTCCSHPGISKDVFKEAAKRLKEELGIDYNPKKLKEIFRFIYKVKVGNLIENEFNHVIFGKFSGNPKPNRMEVEDWKWIEMKKLKKDIKENPKKYTPWFKLILDKLFKNVLP